MDFATLVSTWYHEVVLPNRGFLQAELQAEQLRFDQASSNTFEPKPLRDFSKRERHQLAADIIAMVQQTFPQLNLADVRHVPIQTILITMDPGVMTTDNIMYRTWNYINDFWVQYKRDIKRLGKPEFDRPVRFVSDVEAVFLNSITLSNAFEQEIFKRYISNQRNLPIYVLFEQVAISLQSGHRHKHAIRVNNGSAEERAFRLRLESYRWLCPLYEPHSNQWVEEAILKTLGDTLKSREHILYKQQEENLAIDWINRDFSRAIALLQRQVTTINDSYPMSSSSDTDASTMITIGKLTSTEISDAYQTVITEMRNKMARVADKGEYQDWLQDVQSGVFSSSPAPPSMDQFMTVYHDIVNQQFKDQTATLDQSILELLDTIMHIRFLVMDPDERTALHLVRQTFINNVAAARQQPPPPDQENKYRDDDGDDNDGEDQQQPQILTEHELIHRFEQQLLQYDVHMFRTECAQQLHADLTRYMPRISDVLTVHPWKNIVILYMNQQSEIGIDRYIERQSLLAQLKTSHPEIYRLAPTLTSAQRKRLKEYELNIDWIYQRLDLHVLPYHVNKVKEYTSQLEQDQLTTEQNKQFGSIPMSWALKLLNSCMANSEERARLRRLLGKEIHQESIPFGKYRRYVLDEHAKRMTESLQVKRRIITTRENKNKKQRLSSE